MGKINSILTFYLNQISNIILGTELIERSRKRSCKTNNTATYTNIRQVGSGYFCCTRTNG